ncbi:42386_t:CDS:1, partial [Gigaspora margarita]
MKPAIYILLLLIGTCISHVKSTDVVQYPNSYPSRAVDGSNKLKRKRKRNFKKRLASPELEERQGWTGGLWKRDASPEPELEERQGWTGGLWKRDASPEPELEERQGWTGGLWKRDASPEPELEERQGWTGGLWKRDASPEPELEERQG